MDADHVSVELQRSQGLLFGPTYAADAYSESLCGRLQRGRGVPVEAEAEAEDVTLEVGEVLHGLAHALVDHGLLRVGHEVGAVRCHQFAEGR